MPVANAICPATRGVMSSRSGRSQRLSSRLAEAISSRTFGKAAFGGKAVICLNRDNLEPFARSVLPLHHATERRATCPDPMSAMRGRSQPVDATLYLEGKMECGLMV